MVDATTAIATATTAQKPSIPADGWVYYSISIGCNTTVKIDFTTGKYFEEKEEEVVSLSEKKEDASTTLTAVNADVSKDTVTTVEEPLDTVTTTTNVTNVTNITNVKNVTNVRNVQNVSCSAKCSL